jgi:hypothetical protein
MSARALEPESSVGAVTQGIRYRPEIGHEVCSSHCLPSCVFAEARSRLREVNGLRRGGQ